MSTTRDRIGKRRNFTSGELATEEAIDNIGSIGSQQLLHVLAELLWDEVADAPRSGFPGSACQLDNGATDLEVVLAPGVGLMHDTAETDEFEPHYKPIVVDAADTFSVDAHDSQVRYDLVSLAPLVEADEPGTVTVKDVSSGIISTTSSTLRRRWGFTRVVTKGTPSVSPVRPPTPTGHVPVAYLRVPASTGTVLVEDARPLLTLGQGWHPGPGEAWGMDHVIPSASARSNGELIVTSTGTLDLSVAPGDAVVDGVRVTHPIAELLSATPDATNQRIATVYIDSAGAVGIKHGTPAPSLPVAPSLAADEYGLADIFVGAAATAIGTGDITDTREIGEYIGEGQLRDNAVSGDKIKPNAVDGSKIAAGAVTSTEMAPNSVTGTELANGSVTNPHLATNAVGTSKVLDTAITQAKLSFNLAIPQVTVSTPSSGTQRATIQVVDADGNALAGVRRLRFVMELDGMPGGGTYEDVVPGSDATANAPDHDIFTQSGSVHMFRPSVVTGSLASPGTVTGFTGTWRPTGSAFHRYALYVDTNSSGQAVVDVWMAATGSPTNVAAWAHVQPVNGVGAGTPVAGFPTVVAMQW